MLRKLLVALDGSENAEKSLPWVKRYAGKENSQVVLLRAVPLDDYAERDRAARLDEAHDYIRGIEREFNYAGIPTKTIVKSGRPADVIVKTAASEDADLILMTTRGGSPVKRWLVGGVTEQVLRMSPVPVLTVRSQMPLPHQARVRRIILPVDGSRLAEAPIPWAKRLAKALRAKLVFLHVYPVGAAGLKARNEENFNALRRRLIPVCAELRAEGVKAAFKIQRGDPAERILIYPDRYDLVLTTTHGFGGFKRWVFGSVAEKLIHASEVPVLVWKTPAQVRGKALEAAS